ncbi:hypothetical protein [Streptomyces sp. NPDC059802]|uniref:hypothetical protein n=1 Tax=Streptomyces sp. NPDC059802 TaxID=3346952 RepID=UPI003662689D
MRDQQHPAPAHLRRHRLGRRLFRGYLLAHPGRHLLGDFELVPLGAHLLQLLGQPLFESVQPRTTRGDPLQHLGARHGPDP